MSIKIENLEEVTPDSNTPKEFSEEVYDKLLDQLRKDTLEISTTAIKHANEISKQMIDDTRKELQDLKKNSAKIMAIKINDADVKRLDGEEVVPYLDRMIVNAKLGLNTMLVGPAGCGKTHSAGQLARVLGLEFGHLNLTAGASETWLFGRQTPTGFVEGVFSKLYENGGVFLADEIDAADSNLLLSINTAISSEQFYNPIIGKMIKRHKDFVFIGAANTFGKGSDATYTGRNRLDAATLDRFVVIKVDYNEKIEKLLCPNESIRNTLLAMRKELVNKQTLEFISTRVIEQCYLQFVAGVEWKAIFDSLTLSWSETSRELVKAFRNETVKLEEGQQNTNETLEEVVKKKRGRPKKEVKHEEVKHEDDDGIPF